MANFKSIGKLFAFNVMCSRSLFLSLDMIHQLKWVDGVTRLSWTLAIGVTDGGNHMQRTSGNWAVQLIVDCQVFGYLLFVTHLPQGRISA